MTSRKDGQAGSRKAYPPKGWVEKDVVGGRPDPFPGLLGSRPKDGVAAPQRGVGGWQQIGTSQQQGKLRERIV
eukprot:4292745-Prorocentrum_lima.AAC.1